MVSMTRNARRSDGELEREIAGIICQVSMFAPELSRVLYSILKLTIAPLLSAVSWYASIIDLIHGVSVELDFYLA